MRPLWILTLSCAACGSSPQTQPPGAPPSPASVSVAEPGGDAHDGHWAALTRQLAEPWGRRNDKDDQLHAPMPDWERWKRVRFWGVKHFTGFRYGDDHHVVSVAFVLEVPEGSKQSSATCMRRFEAWVRPQIRGHEIQLTPQGEHTVTWKEQSIAIKSVDGYVDTAFSRREFSAAWAAYPAYPDACLVYGVAVPWRKQRELARQVRDRWVQEGFEKIVTLTETRPVRKEE
ncbi:MAG: hypothetical protein KF718_28635 [Polyangiaceae bacterium]|nr:hypothetical protein [Polyangiaceae bacterium]